MHLRSNQIGKNFCIVDKCEREKALKNNSVFPIFSVFCNIRNWLGYSSFSLRTLLPLREPICVIHTVTSRNRNFLSQPDLDEHGYLVAVFTKPSANHLTYTKTHIRIRVLHKSVLFSFNKNPQVLVHVFVSENMCEDGQRKNAAALIGAAYEHGCV